MADIDSVLKDLYQSEINFELSTFWDAGYTIRLGDKLNGFVGESDMLDTLTEVACEIVKMVIKHFPKSDFAKKYSGVLDKDE